MPLALTAPLPPALSITLPDAAGDTPGPASPTTWVLGPGIDRIDVLVLTNDAKLELCDEAGVWVAHPDHLLAGAFESIPGLVEAFNGRGPTGLRLSNWTAGSAGLLVKLRVFTTT